MKRFIACYIGEGGLGFRMSDILIAILSIVMYVLILVGVAVVGLYFGGIVLVFASIAFCCWLLVFILEGVIWWRRSD